MKKHTKRDYYELLTVEEQFMYKSNYESASVDSRASALSFEKFLDDSAKNFHSFLSSGFFWMQSEQGHDFWARISDEGRYLPEWTNVYYDLIDMISDKDSIIIRSGCKSIKLPLKVADTIAEEMLLSGLITSFVIPEIEIDKTIIFECKEDDKV